jgi:predicted phage-related endonuclease
MDNSEFYSGLGASVCAAILGEDKHKSPYDLWHEFVHPESRPNLDDNEAVEAGVALEPAIAQWAAKRLGVTIDYKPGALIQHPNLPFMRCHPDAMVVGEAAGMEVKNRGLQTARVYAELADFQDEMDRAQATEVLQCHASMAVHKAAKCWYLGVAVGGQRLLTFKIPRDDDICRAIEGKYETFWNGVLTKTPPPPINTSDCNRLWPTQVPGSVVEATEEIAAAVMERERIKASQKDEKRQLDFLDLKIKSFMRDAEELRVGGKKALTWKAQKRGEYKVEATEFRVLR